MTFFHHNIKTNIYLWSLHIGLKSATMCNILYKIGGPANEIEVTKTFDGMFPSVFTKY